MFCIMLKVHLVTDRQVNESDVWLNWATENGEHNNYELSIAAREITIPTGFSVVQTDCPMGHHRSQLCCKSGVEFENYYRERSRKRAYRWILLFADHFQSAVLVCRWYCHFDDDMYVNIPVLLSSLGEHDPLQQRVYIGQWPLAAEHLSVPQRFSQTFPRPVSDSDTVVHVDSFLTTCSWSEGPTSMQQELLTVLVRLLWQS